MSEISRDSVLPAEQEVLGDYQQILAARILAVYQKGGRCPKGSSVVFQDWGTDAQPSDGASFIICNSRGKTVVDSHSLDYFADMIKGTALEKVQADEQDSRRQKRTQRTGQRATDGNNGLPAARLIGEDPKVSSSPIKSSVASAVPRLSDPQATASENEVVPTSNSRLQAEVEKQLAKLGHFDPGTETVKLNQVTTPKGKTEIHFQVNRQDGSLVLKNSVEVLGKSYAKRVAEQAKENKHLHKEIRHLLKETGFFREMQELGLGEDNFEVVEVDETDEHSFKLKPIRFTKDQEKNFVVDGYVYYVNSLAKLRRDLSSFKSGQKQKNLGTVDYFLHETSMGKTVNAVLDRNLERRAQRLQRVEQRAAERGRKQAKDGDSDENLRASRSLRDAVEKALFYGGEGVSVLETAYKAILGTAAFELLHVTGANKITGHVWEHGGRELLDKAVGKLMKDQLTGESVKVSDKITDETARLMVTDFAAMFSNMLLLPNLLAGLPINVLELNPSEIWSIFRTTKMIGGSVGSVQEFMHELKDTKHGLEKAGMVMTAAVAAPTFLLLEKMGFNLGPINTVLVGDLTLMRLMGMLKELTQGTEVKTSGLWKFLTAIESGITLAFAADGAKSVGSKVMQKFVIGELGRAKTVDDVVELFNRGAFNRDTDPLHAVDQVENDVLTALGRGHKEAPLSVELKDEKTGDKYLYYEVNGQLVRSVGANMFYYTDNQWLSAGELNRLSTTESAKPVVTNSTAKEVHPQVEPANEVPPNTNVDTGSIQDGKTLHIRFTLAKDADGHQESVATKLERLHALADGQISEITDKVEESQLVKFMKDELGINFDDPASLDRLQKVLVKNGIDQGQVEGDFNLTESMNFINHGDRIGEVRVGVESGDTVSGIVQKTFGIGVDDSIEIRDENDKVISPERYALIRPDQWLYIIHKTAQIDGIPHLLSQANDTIAPVDTKSNDTKTVDQPTVETSVLPKNAVGLGEISTDKASLSALLTDFYQSHPDVARSYNDFVNRLDTERQNGNPLIVDQKGNPVWDIVQTGQKIFLLDSKDVLRLQETTDIATRVQTIRRTDLVDRFADAANQQTYLQRLLVSPHTQGDGLNQQLINSGLVRSDARISDFSASTFDGVYQDGTVAVTLRDGVAGSAIKYYGTAEQATLLMLGEHNLGKFIDMTDATQAAVARLPGIDHTVTHDMLQLPHELTVRTATATKADLGSAEGKQNFVLAQAGRQDEELANFYIYPDGTIATARPLDTHWSGERGSRNEIVVEMVRAKAAADNFLPAQSDALDRLGKALRGTENQEGIQINKILVEGNQLPADLIKQTESRLSSVVSKLDDVVLNQGAWINHVRIDPDANGEINAQVLLDSSNSGGVARGALNTTWNRLTKVAEYLGVDASHLNTRPQAAERLVQLMQSGNQDSGALEKDVSLFELFQTLGVSPQQLTRDGIVYFDFAIVSSGNEIDLNAVATQNGFKALAPYLRSREMVPGVRGIGLDLTSLQSPEVRIAVNQALLDSGSSLTLDTLLPKGIDPQSNGGVLYRDENGKYLLNSDKPDLNQVATVVQLDTSVERALGPDKLFDIGTLQYSWQMRQSGLLPVATANGTESGHAYIDPVSKHAFVLSKDGKQLLEVQGYIASVAERAVVGQQDSLGIIENDLMADLVAGNQGLTLSSDRNFVLDANQQAYTVHQEGGRPMVDAKGHIVYEQAYGGTYVVEHGKFVPVSSQLMSDTDYVTASGWAVAVDANEVPYTDGRGLPVYVHTDGSRIAEIMTLTASGFTARTWDEQMAKSLRSDPATRVDFDGSHRLFADKGFLHQLNVDQYRAYEKITSLEKVADQLARVVDGSRLDGAGDEAGFRDSDGNPYSLSHTGNEPMVTKNGGKLVFVGQDRLSYFLDGKTIQPLGTAAVETRAQFMQERGLHLVKADGKISVDWFDRMPIYTDDDGRVFVLRSNGVVELGQKEMLAKYGLIGVDVGGRTLEKPGMDFNITDLLNEKFWQGMLRQVKADLPNVENVADILNSILDPVLRDLVLQLQDIRATAIEFKNQGEQLIASESSASSKPNVVANAGHQSESLVGYEGMLFKLMGSIVEKAIDNLQIPSGGSTHQFDTVLTNAVPLENISPYLQMATMAFEDKRFAALGGGVDTLGPMRAVRDLADTGKVMTGGSNITTQTSRELLSIDASKTLERKIGDLVRAQFLSMNLSPREILTAYENLGNFGGVEGIGAAANKWFGKDPGSLNLAESVLLAGMVQMPSRYNAASLDNVNALLRRANDGLDLMNNNQMVSDAEIARARVEINRMLLPGREETLPLIESMVASGSLPVPVKDPALIVSRPGENFIEALQREQVFGPHSTDLMQAYYDQQLWRSHIVDAEQSTTATAPRILTVDANKTATAGEIAVDRAIPFAQITDQYDVVRTTDKDGNSVVVQTRNGGQLVYSPKGGLKELDTAGHLKPVEQMIIDDSGVTVRLYDKLNTQILGHDNNNISRDDLWIDSQQNVYELIPDPSQAQGVRWNYLGRVMQQAGTEREAIVPLPRSSTVELLQAKDAADSQLAAWQNSLRMEGKFTNNGMATKMSQMAFELASQRDDYTIIDPNLGWAKALDSASTGLTRTDVGIYPRGLEALASKAGLDVTPIETSNIADFLSVLQERLTYGAKPMVWLSNPASGEDATIRNVGTHDHVVLERAVKSEVTVTVEAIFSEPGTNGESRTFVVYSDPSHTDGGKAHDVMVTWEQFTAMAGKFGRYMAAVNGQFDLPAGFHDYQSSSRDAQVENFFNNTEVLTPEQRTQFLAENTTIDPTLNQHNIELAKPFVTANGGKGLTAIMMNPETGAVLSAFSLDEKGQENSTSHAFTDIMTPGSVAKVLTLAAAAHYGIDTNIPQDTPNILQIPDGMGGFHILPTSQGVNKPITGAEALAVSHNVYFYQLGERIAESQGLDAVARFAHSIGIGVDSAVHGIPSSHGTVGDPAWASEAKTQFGITDAGFMGMGQGPISLSAMEITRLMAAVANHGQEVVPTTVKGASSEKSGQLPLSSEQVAGMRQALRTDVTDGVISAPFIGVESRTGIKFYGKTSTAETGNNSNNQIFSGFAEDKNGRQIAFTVTLSAGQGRGFDMIKLATGMVEEYFAQLK